MKLHPMLSSPRSVLVYQANPGASPGWQDFQQAAYQAMSVMGFSLEGEKIVIKPNVTSGEHFADPDTGITTHPGFVQGLVEFLQSDKHRNNGHKNIAITIAEDPRNSDDNEHRHWRNTGFEQVAAKTGARLHTTTTYTCIKKEVPKPMAFPVLNVSRLATAANTILINVPKLKTHNLAITTLCMKNLMGLVNVFDRHYCAQAWRQMPVEIRDNESPRNEWFEKRDHEEWQAGLARRLVDTAQVIQPALNIVEGIVGREGTGFQRGRNRALGLVVAGTNMVAVDSVASYLMGFDPLKLIYLDIAHKAGLGENDISKLEIFTHDNGELLQCPDVRTLRLNPPMQVISNIKGENPLLFNQAEPVTADISTEKI